MKAFAIFGNPIKHSKSPEIYSLFAKEMKITDEYDVKLVLEKDFSSTLFNFFHSGGLGANITIPFKERALSLCDHLTERAILSNTVNTIKRQNDNTLLGDNTDGIGLMNDLKRLQWLHKDNTFIKDSNNYQFMMTNILIIGAGGAAKGITSSLLKINKCYINITNRTLSRAKQLVHYYHSIGYQNISYIDIKKLSCICNKKKYNLIINATSSSMYKTRLIIPSSLITNKTRCYDLFYQKEDTTFIKWCKENGSNYCADGLGMLVEQAAYAFNLWHNVSPPTTPVFNYLQSTFRI